MKYWFQGLPFGGVDTTGNDPGTMSFWFQGLPVPWQQQPPYIPPARFVNMRAATARKRAREPQRRRVSKRLPASLLAPAPVLILRANRARRIEYKAVTKRHVRRLSAAVIPTVDGDDMVIFPIT